MEARIIGLKGCGKTTLVTALAEGRGEGHMASVHVGDPRVRALSEVFQPKKTTYAEFRAQEVKRVQKWRLENPGYSQKSHKTNRASTTDPDNKDPTSHFIQTSKQFDTLRDLVIRQEFIVVGMASKFAGPSFENVESFLLSCCDTGRQYTCSPLSAVNFLPFPQMSIEEQNHKTGKKVPS